MDLRFSVPELDLIERALIEYGRLCLSYPPGDAEWEIANSQEIRNVQLMHERFGRARKRVAANEEALHARDVRRRGRASHAIK